jgi:hypothetical protein
MARKKFVVACFNEEAVLFPAVKKVRNAGYKIHDVYTPFAVHGLDHALGMRETSLHTAGFIYGITGTTTALTCMSWIFTRDWPLNIGGKPHLPLRFAICASWLRLYGTIIFTHGLLTTCL